jgi:hypothetical protein
MSMTVRPSVARGRGVRGIANHRVGLLATVTGISVGIAGVLLFVGFGPLAGSDEPNPADAAATRPGPNVGRPSFPGFPTLPGRPGAGPSTGPGSTTGPPGDVHPNAPTDNLRRLATALRLKHKSTTGVLTVAAGLNLTNPVEVSILWDEVSPRPTRATQDYNDATGIRFIYPFPDNRGAARLVKNVITLTERTAGGEFIPYSVRSDVTIKPLYDITVSPLVATLPLNCDTVGASELIVQWRTPDDRAGEFTLDTYGGTTFTISAFAQTYTEVGQSNDLRTPNILFREEDPDSGFNGRPYLSEQRLLPGSDRNVDLLLIAGGDSNCGLRIRYSITFKLREYLYLE